MDEMAQAKNFFVLAPEQSVLMNIDHCWNWFFDFNQRRSFSNEMGQVMAAITLVSQTYRIDTDRIFVAGMSAGGAMAANFAACYPDIFAGAAVHSGLAYKIAENLVEAQTVLTASKLKSPSYLGKKAYECGRAAGRRKFSRMVLIHGDRDPRVDPFHSRLISESNEVLMDYIDDGKRNYSSRYKKGEQTFRHLSGYEVDVQERIYSTRFSEITYLVKGMAHSWGGGKPITSNFEENAPSSTDFILNYFGL
jgi:poly(hydroxyalkanoate) depolymerase family esterase